MASTNWDKVAANLLGEINEAEGVAVVALDDDNMEKGHEYNKGNFAGIIGSMEMQRRNKNWDKQRINVIAKQVHQNNSSYDAVFVAFTGEGFVGGSWTRSGATKEELEDAVVQARNEFIDEH